MHPYLDVDGPQVVAHRGGSRLAPENTMAAFARAIALGVRWIETDLRITADGVLVTFHDRALLRLCGRPGRIEDLTWSELARVRVEGREPIPRLDDVLSTWPDLRVNVDLKDQRVLAGALEFLGRDDRLARIGVGSFSDRRLWATRARFGDRVCTSAGPLGVAAMRLRSLGIPARIDAASCYQVPVRPAGVILVDQKFVDAAHAAGRAVHVWTIDDPTEMRRLLELGVDALITDRPDLAVEVVARHRSS